MNATRGKLKLKKQKSSTPTDEATHLSQQCLLAGLENLKGFFAR